MKTPLSDKSGIIKEIAIGREKGKPREAIPEGFFEIDYGLRGDVHGGPGDKQVVLFGEEGREKLAGSPETGLCFTRFVPTLATEGIALYEFPVGTRIKIGESIMAISRIGKRCFPECGLVKAGTPCVMPKEVVFARVVEGGWVRVGDRVQMIGSI